eukprot:gene28148-49960_t
MFGPKVVGTANAAAAGWGNAGGGAAQALMPLLVAAIVMLGVSETLGWRVALLVPGVLMVVMAGLYWKFTQDCPAGNYSDLRAAGVPLEAGKKGGWDSFKAAAANHRVWLLFVTYGACFGVEIFIHNIAAVYYVDHFGLSLKSAGLAAGSFGLLALFARALGGWISDRYFGKYNTILWMSLVYVCGHACLAIFEDNLQGFYFGLFLIAFGAGGIKPLVSAFVGDQFDQTNKNRAKTVYDAFYWMINFGSFFASLLMPLFLKNLGPAIAF